MLTTIDCDIWFNCGRDDVHRVLVVVVVHIPDCAELQTRQHLSWAAKIVVIFLLFVFISCILALCLDDLDESHFQL